MERLSDDVWFLGTDPSVTSSLKFQLIDGHSPLIGQGPTVTGSCGLGWRFVVTATNSDIHVDAGGGRQTHQKTIFQISLEPHQVAATNLARLTATATGENLTCTTQCIRTPVDTSSDRTLLASYTSSDDFTGNAVVTIIIAFNSSFSMIQTSETVIPKLQTVLESSLMGREFYDIKFYLFKRRLSRSGTTDQSGRVYDPELIFANADLLRGSCNSVDDFLDGKGNHEIYSELDHHWQLPGDTVTAYDYYSDSDLEDDDDAPEDPDIGEGKKKVPKRALLEDPSNIAENERIVLVKDTAYETWKCLVFYLYTKEIHFRPLHSNNTPSVARVDAINSPPACSPKSMYRLAHKIGFSELKALALKAIAGSLVECNILTEVFSLFTSRYPEVQAIEVEALVKLLTPIVFQKLLHKMKAAVDGKMPHCYDVVDAVMHKLYDASDRDTCTNDKVTDDAPVANAHFQPSCIPKEEPPVASNPKEEPGRGKASPSKRMERLSNDVWSLGTNPFSVTSSFKLVLVDGRSPLVGKGPESCGLGWRFVFTGTKDDPVLHRTTYDVSLEPYRINATTLTQLAVSITVDHLSIRTQGASTISLDTSSSRSILATYIVTGDASITIKVEFSPLFSASQPVVPKLQHVLESSLLGHKFGDTKFFLFTCRVSGKKGVVGNPELVFANESLLRGFCAHWIKVSSAVKYPEVQKIELDALTKILTSTVFEKLLEKMAVVKDAMVSWPPSCASSTRMAGVATLGALWIDRRLPLSKRRYD
ncbi:hypothetical protein DXG03_009750 [Asterophora parasitica]|uniref:BTB domain-containing protein n=1 Tax=Asterophora parasitica TaxID=117018 RepID=A0A9P7G5W5_9AGAR|nr:hypothetical protein DXG03_009750 [Asterophora parasitica]